MSQAENKGKIFQSRIPFILDPGKKIPKKIEKKIKKIKKSLSGNTFNQNGSRQAEKGKKKFQSRIPFILRPGKKIPKKIPKKLKNLFPALFFAKTGNDRPKKRAKNFSPEFRSYSAWGRKFRKKSKKLKKKNPFRHYFQPKRDELG